MTIVDLALLLCPREFREGYRRDFRHSSSSDALNLAWTGVALRCETVARDVIFAVRSLVKAPLFASVAVLTLALAISVNAVVFGAIEALLMKPLPFSQPDKLLFLCYKPAQSSCGQIYSGIASLYAREAKTLQSVAGFEYYPETLLGHGPPQALLAYVSSENIFDVLRMRPELGRFFTPGRSFGQVVISDALWRSAFSANPNVIGRVISLDGRRMIVAGVAPPNTVMPVPGAPADVARTLWIAVPPQIFSLLDSTNVWTFARVSPGSSINAVKADVDRVASQIRRQYPIKENGLGIAAIPFTSVYFADTRRFLFLTLAAVFAVLLIACANVANLLLARGVTRSAEFAVRNTLGASRSRILHQFAVEVAILVVSGGIAGLFLAWLELREIVALGSQLVIPELEKASIDGNVVLFTFAILLIASVVAGLVPALLSTRGDLSAALKPAGRGGDPSGTNLMRSGLAATQIALAFAVIIASGLLYRSFVHEATASTGMDTRNVYWAMANLYGRRYDQASMRSSFINSAVRRLSALPGVESVAMVRPNPYLQMGLEAATFRLPGHLYAHFDQPSAVVTQITPKYFDLLRVPLQAGRAFGNHDTAASPRVAIVDRHFAQKYFGSHNPIGEHILLPPINPVNRNAPFLPATIVGVVSDIPLFGRPDEPRLYVPQSQAPSRAAEIFLKVRTPDSRLRAHVAAAIASIDPLEALEEFDSFPAYIDRAYIASLRVSAALLGAIASIALFLALTGIYAIVAYSVEQRRHELGVRLAVGAARSSVLRNVLMGTLRIGAVGFALGIVLAAFAGRLLSNLLFGISTLDPSTFIAVTAILFVSIVAASLVPALRAARVDPAVALRYE